MRLVILVLVFAGCGRSGFEELRSVDAAAEAPADAIDAAIDAAIDGPALTPCGATTLIDDPFDDAVAAPAFTANPDVGLTLVETGGHIDVQFTASVNGGNYAYYRSATAYAAEGLCATAEVSQVPTAGASAYFKLRTAQQEVEFFATNGFIALRTSQSGSPTVRLTFPIDLAANRFWRVRQQGGTTYWETSANGNLYITRTSVAGVFTAMMCQVEIGAGTQNTATNAGLARFDSALVRGP